MFPVILGQSQQTFSCSIEILEKNIKIAKLSTYFTPFLVSIVDFEHVFVCWVCFKLLENNKGEH